MNDLFDEDKLKCLPLYEAKDEPRLYHKQRLELEHRAAFIRRVRDTGSPQLDPVLRCHLGLEEPPPKVKLPNKANFGPQVIESPSDRCRRHETQSDPKLLNRRGRAD